MVDHSMCEALTKQIKETFRSNQNVVDVVARKSLMISGLHFLSQIRSLARKAPKQSGGEESWLSTSDEVDERGRVGEGWPWDLAVNENKPSEE